MSEIEVYQTQQGRFYRFDDKSYPSVNTILDRVQPREYLEKWSNSLGKAYLKEAVDYSLLSETEKLELSIYYGKSRSSNIARSAAQTGNSFHSKIERFLKCRDSLPRDVREDRASLGKLYDLLCASEPIAIEERVFWEEGGFGFGGTLDAILKLNEPYRIKNSLGESVWNKPIKLLFDWKHPKKLKYPKQKNRLGYYYYPLIRYCLQASAYAKAKETPDMAGAAIVMLSHSNRLKIYYLNSETIDWYWNYFQEILACHYKMEPFNWRAMELETDKAGYLGEEIFWI
jgi:hypothetical protein